MKSDPDTTSIEIPSGLLNIADVDAPSKKSAMPLFPATVMTNPVKASIFRTRLFKSVIKMFPSLSREMPEGELKDASVPSPSKSPAAPLPAMVLTAPFEMVILLIRLL